MLLLVGLSSILFLLISLPEGFGAWSHESRDRGSFKVAGAGLIHDQNHQSGHDEQANPLSNSASSVGSASQVSVAATTCADPATQFHLSDPPYEDYFYSDCHLSAQVVVTSPLEDSSLTSIGPRLLIAWPAGNSGAVAYFAPVNGVNGSLSIALQNFTSASQPLVPYYQPAPNGSANSNPIVGVTGVITFNSSATLTVPILGSIRTIRDFSEGPSILVPEIQDAISVASAGGALVSRLWLDNTTTTELLFTPYSNASVNIDNQTVHLTAGTYNFTARYNYPQLEQLSTSEVLDPQDQGIINQEPEETESLSFLSYTTKLLAGGWRFLTYFGRDSMISLLLLQPVLSEGENGAIEAVISAVLERINRTDGSVCHEETIGDYATYLNDQAGINSSAPQYDYKMIDSDYYLPVVMKNYFVDSATGQNRTSSFFAINATVNPTNAGLTYADLALITAEKIMNTSAPFAANGGQTMENLIHLKDGQTVGQWRDSNSGIGGGRIPYDVNTALVPAALRAIASLSSAGFFPSHPEWNTTAATYAQIWEDSTLSFFAINIPTSEAQSLVDSYVSQSNATFPSESSNITSPINFYGLSLDGSNNQSTVKVMNTDDCFRHFLLNTTNQTQLTALVNQTANNIIAPFPTGLSTSVGLLVSNPAYGGDPTYAATWTNTAYHGTVVWSWQLSMMAAGLQRQLARCNSTSSSSTSISDPSSASVPNFCADSGVYLNVKAAYNHLWDLIEGNSAHLTEEVWSWVYSNGDFVFEPLGALPLPNGGSPTESDIVQLWSLTFLAVKRDEGLR
ncbi:MAG: hypothetical protein M1820_007116 [Bogoriella megaspora]|nr:MAG: hypothetical protein M1820_007116 [Bogoriella megaspora]